MKTTPLPSAAALFLAAACQLACVPTNAAVLPLPKPAEVFERHFSALGGRKQLEQIHTVRVRGTVTENQQEYGFELVVQAPGRILLTVTNGSGMSVLQGRDDRARCWRQGPAGVRALGDQEAGELMDMAMGFHVPSLLGLATLMNQSVVARETNGQQIVLTLGPKSGGTFPHLVFEESSGRLVQAGATRLDDYRPVQGLQLPFIARAGPEATLRVTEATLNPTFDARGFDMPAVSTNTPTQVSAAYADQLSATGRLEIVRRPMPLNFGRGSPATIPSYDPRSSRHAQVDLRSSDLRKLDLTSRLTDLLHADHDSRTRWPEALPDGFSPARIMDLGRDPGLGIRQLHARGITGQGIGIGIIDQPLLVDHAEYADRLRLYEEIHSPPGSPAAMHGPAVTSIAAGKTVGVAPGAELYYIAEQHGTSGPRGEFDWDFTWLAKSIHRLLDLNATLPPQHRLRVISISVGWSPGQKGYAESMAAVARATRERVFVVSTALEQTHHLAFHGLGRESLGEPNTASAYGPGSWWSTLFWDGSRRFAPGERLLVPMDSRTVASPTGPDDYVFYSSGGWSWSVPWIAGLYALACQVNPAITPEQFWAEGLRTGHTIQVSHDGTELEFGTIANPAALLEAVAAMPR